MRFRSLLACAVSLALLVPAADAAAAAKRPATRVVLKAPKGGDVSYAVVQVRLGGAKTPKKAEGKVVWSKAVAGVKVAATSPAWPELRATTKAYVMVAKVDGGASDLRNVTFVIARRAGAKARGGGAITFTVPGTSPATGSFWVRKVDKRTGVADVFHATDAAANAVKNWSKYLTVLRAANAVKAAFHAIDVNGTFEDKKRPVARAAGAGAQAHAAATAAVTIGGHRTSPLGKKLVTLFFGTLADRDAYQALKRSSLVTDFLRKDLNNPKLADRWGSVTEALPPMVPDAYASNAKEEKRFGKVAAPRIAHTSVRISDARNASEQAAIETPRAATDTLPGLRVDVEFRGTPNVGEVHGYQYLGVSKDSPTLVTCRSACSSFWPQGVTPHFEAVTDGNTVFNGWEGCGNGTEKKGTICKVRLPEGDFPPALKLIATFTRAGGTSSGGGGGTTTPAPQQPTPPGPTPNGAVGKLDAAFGTNGYTLTEVGAGNGFGATGLARQSTGKLIQVGTGDPVTSVHTKVLRYTADGKADGSFGTGGVVTLPTVVDEFYGYAVAVDGADRIVIAGQFRDINSGDLRLGVVRLTPDGAVDPTFGGGGQVDLPVGTDGYVAPHAIQLAADGTIYVAGSTYVLGQSAVALAALDAGGTPVSGFGTGGVLVDQPDGRFFGATALALTQGGLVVTGGDADGPLLARYTTAGALDPAFNGGHVLVMAPGGAYAHGGAQAVAEQADGKLVTAGYVEKADNSGNCLIAQRVTAGGAPDASFGAGGTAVACEGAFSGAEAVAVDGNGIYAAGHSYGATSTSVLLVRFTATGAIDAAGFDGGIFTHAPVGDSRASAMLLQDGHPVLGGEAYTSTSNQFLLERVVGH